jgi:KUP system potassium uptake protein
MGITTLLLAVVERERWHWSILGILGFGLPVLIIDFAFFGANIIKVRDGGWFPLAIGIFAFTLMTTWRTGREILSRRLREQTIAVEDFLRDLARNSIPRVPGTAIFMSRNMEGVPTTMLHNIKHNKVVHQRVILLTVASEETPHLDTTERHELVNLGQGIYRLVIRFGFMEEPNIPELLDTLEVDGAKLQPMMTSYFLGRETLVVTRAPGMAIWREKLFAWMMRNASSASNFFCLPANQVIELGAQIEI